MSFASKPKVGDPKATDFIIPHRSEAVKTYATYDASQRLEYFYTAMADAQHGDRCLVTQYTYDGTSGRVVKSKESLSLWDSSWDI
jgi:hypothetical protein